MRELTLALAAAVSLAVLPAAAAVDGVGDNGFAVTETTHVAAPPDRVYAALIAPAHWWDSAHTYSQNAANLSLDAKAGGCWCETVPDGGSVQHMTVVYAAPGRVLRLRGALGPLQGMGVDGAMSVSLRPTEGGTDVTLAYAVGGYAGGGFSEVSGAVDRVLGEQLARMNSFVETGSPDRAHSDSNSKSK